MHIEQAPSLAVDGFAVAIGTAVPGNVRYAQARIVGEYGHVGLPRRFRKDAALAGADILVGLDDIWKAAEAQGQPMAFTVGEFHTNTQRHGLTIVPGEFRFSLDLRAYDQTFLDGLEQQFLTMVKTVEKIVVSTLTSARAVRRPWLEPMKHFLRRCAPVPKLWVLRHRTCSVPPLMMRPPFTAPASRLDLCLSAIPAAATTLVKT